MMRESYSGTHAQKGVRRTGLTVQKYMNGGPGSRPSSAVPTQRSDSSDWVSQVSSSRPGSAMNTRRHNQAGYTNRNVPEAGRSWAREH